MIAYITYFNVFHKLWGTPFNLVVCCVGVRLWVVGWVDGRVGVWISSGEEGLGARRRRAKFYRAVRRAKIQLVLHDCNFLIKLGA